MKIVNLKCGEGMPKSAAPYHRRHPGRFIQIVFFSLNLICYYELLNSFHSADCTLINRLLFADL